MGDAGVVIIGRNEGERLRLCLQSCSAGEHPCVYVDSGSTDGSVALARAVGVEVVELDRSTPFTAARARNAGFERLIRIAPDLRFVQFVDGDCEIVSGWLERAQQRLAERSELAVVCGRRRERFPQASVYNRLCDLEWDTPIGDTDACGGDSMMRVEALREAGCFDPRLIAGEEPDLCLRLRLMGWKIERLDLEMTLHDAAMTRFSQWWQREKRSGHAAAEGAAMHGHLPERFRIAMLRSNALWGGLIPLLAIAPSWPTRGWSLVLLLMYPIQWLRLVLRFTKRRGLPADAARLLATFCLISKFPQALGQARYWTGRILRRRSGLIEYKGAAAPLNAPPPAQAEIIQ